MNLHPDTQTFLARSPHKLLIDGEWTPALSGETYTSINPSDGTALAEIASAGREDVDRAVVAARRAFENGWADDAAARARTAAAALGRSDRRPRR